MTLPQLRMLCADRKKNQRTFVRLHSAPLPTIMIAMYVPPSSCKADKGDYFTRLSIMNKQDYVRWFSGELMIGTQTFDTSLRPAGHHEVRILCNTQEGTWAFASALHALYIIHKEDCGGWFSGGSWLAPRPATRPCLLDIRGVTSCGLFCSHARDLWFEPMQPVWLCVRCACMMQ